MARACVRCVRLLCTCKLRIQQLVRTYTKLADVLRGQPDAGRT